MLANENSRIRYRPEIDGLRALAVLPVLFFHAGFGLFQGGYVGVDLFFVISGYLITRVIRAELQAGKFSLWHFYGRRARRILPALLVVMGCCLPFVWFWMEPSATLLFAKSLVAVSVMASNVLFWRESGYFDAASGLKPLLHTWSVSLEEQFYLLFPLFLMAVARLRRQTVLLCLLLAAASSLAIAQWGAIHKPADAYFLLPTRAWELLVGALLAICSELRIGADAATGRAGWLDQVASLAGLALVFGCVFAFDHATPFPGLYALVPVTGTALLIWYGVSTTWVGQLLAHPALVRVGLISYSAYLWHQPMFAFARYRVLGEPHWSVFAALIVAALVLAYFTWRFVEQPFRNAAVISGRRLRWSVLGGTAAFIAIGVAGYAGEGFGPARLNAAQLHALQTAVPSPKRTECHTGGEHFRSPRDACRFFAAPARWAVFGDSHAVEIAYALALRLKERGDGVRQFSFSGCPPAYQRDSSVAGCSAWTAEAVQWIVNDPGIERVVVSYRLNAELWGPHEGVYPRQPDAISEAQRQATWASYKQLLQTFRGAGKQVLVVLQAPEVAAPVERLIFRDPRAVDLASVPRRWWDARTEFVRQRLTEIAGGVAVIDPAQYLCDATQCFAARGGVAFYCDDDHLSVAGADLVAADVLRWADGATLTAGANHSGASKR